MRMLLTAIAVMLLAASMLPAQKLEERVVATVNNEPILKSDLDRIIEATQSQGMPPDVTPDSLRKLALDNLVNRKVIMAEAQRESLRIEPADIEKALDQEIQKWKAQFPSEKAFKDELKRNGMTLEGVKGLYREDMKYQMSLQRLVEKFIKPKVSDPTSKDIEEYYTIHKDSLPTEPEKVELEHILIAFKPSNQAIADARAKVRQVQAQLRAKKDFAEVAKKYSQDIESANRGGDLGWIGLDQVPPEMAQLFMSLKTGQVSEPVETAIGYQFFKVYDRRGNQVKASRILIRMASEADIRRARKTADALRERVLTSKENFKQLAKDYSDDTQTKANGGYWGVQPITMLPAGMKDELAGMKEGDISEAVETEYGFDIFHLIKRTQAEKPSLDTVREDVRNYLKNKRMDDEFRKWLDERKAKDYTIEIKP